MRLKKMGIPILVVFFSFSDIFFFNIFISYNSGNPSKVNEWKCYPRLERGLLDMGEPAPFKFQPRLYTAGT